MKSTSYGGRLNRSLFSGLYLTALAALLFTFSARSASADIEVWTGAATGPVAGPPVINTSAWNNPGNWIDDNNGQMHIPVAANFDNAYFLQPTNQMTVTFSSTDATGEPRNLIFEGSGEDYTIGSPGDTVGLTFTQGQTGILVFSSLQGSNGFETINSPITTVTNNQTYINNYTPAAGANSLAALPGLAGSGTNNVLNINGNINGSGGQLLIYGLGNVNLNGSIQTTGQNIFVDTLGTVTLSGTNNTFNGIPVIGGTVVIDNVTNNDVKIPTGNTVILGDSGHGGNLVINGNSAGTTVSFAVTDIQQGASSLVVNPGGGGVTTVNLGQLNFAGANGNSGGLSGLNIVMPTGSILNAPGSQVVVTTTSQNANFAGGFNTINSSATINGTYFAQAGTAFSTGSTQAPTAITALTVDDGDSFSSGVGNYTVNNGVAGTQQLGGGGNASTIRFNAGAGNSTLDLNGNGLHMNLGGILVTQGTTGNTFITDSSSGQTGSLNADGTFGGLAIMNYGTGTLTISANISSFNNERLSKYGQGNVILASQSYAPSNSAIIDESGELELGSANGFGTENQLVLGDNTALVDFHGNSVTLSGLYNDTNMGVPGSQAAALGFDSQIANSVGGTISRVTLSANGSNANNSGNFTNFQNNALGSYFGGWNEASGAILSLALNSGSTSSGVYQFDVGTGTVGDPTGGNAVDASGINGTSNVITGSVTIGQNTALGLGIYGMFNTLGVTTLNGGIGGFGGQGGNYGTTYLVGNGMFDSGTFNFYTVNLQGTGTDTFAGDFGSASWQAGGELVTGGTGTLSLTNAVYAGGVVTTDESKVILPSVQDGANTEMLGRSNVTVTGTSGAVLANFFMFGGGLTVAPGGSGGNVTVSAGGFQYTGAGSLFLDKGANTSLTLQLNGNTFDQGNLNGMEGNQNGSFLEIGTAQGLSALGTTDKILMSGTPWTPNGILSPSIIGVDYANNQAGTFLTYNGSGTSPAGVVAYTSPTTDINASGFTNVVDVGTNHETLNGTVGGYAIEIDKGGSVTTGGNAIQIGDFVNTGEGGIILNGGSIDGNIQVIRATRVYTSLDNGTIDNVQLFGNQFAKGGAGTLYVPSLNDNNNNGFIEVSQGALDTNWNTVAPGNLLILDGGVMQGNGVMNRTLGGSFGSGQLQWEGPTDAGGFSARGGNLTVNLNGGSQLVWGGTGAFVGDGGILMFGSTTSDNVVTLTNNLDLGTISGVFNTGGALYSRVVDVAANTNDAGIDPLNVSDYAVLSGVISQTNPYQGLTKSDNGVLYLTGNNTYTGATTIAGGALVISSDSNLGTAPTAAYALNTTPTDGGVVVTGGALTPGAVLIDAGATLVTTNSLALGGALGTRTILLGSGTSGSVAAGSASNIDVVGATNTLTFNGLIGDYVNEKGVLNKEGDGTLALGGNSFYTGATVISAGTINLTGTLNNANPWTGVPGGTGTVGGAGTDLVFQNKGGSFIYNYTSPGSGPAQSTPGAQNMGALDLNGGAATIENNNVHSDVLSFTSLSNPITQGASVNFILPSTGAIKMAGVSEGVLAPNAYFGGDDFAFYDTTGGVTSVNNYVVPFVGQGWGVTPGTTVTGGLIYNATDTADGGAPYVLTASGGAIAQTQSASITGLLLEDGDSIVQSVGTTLTVQGILNSNLSQTGGTSAISGGELTSGGGALTVRVDASSDLLNIGDDITSTTTGGLTMTGNGTLILSNGGNAYTGGTYITGGTLQLGDGTNDGNFGSGTVTNYASLVINNNANTIIGNNITGDGSLTLTGGNDAGTVELTGTNTYTGATAVQNGTLQIATSASLSSQTPVVLGNGSNSGVLVLGDGTGGAVSVTLANITTSGTGNGNAIVSGNASMSNLAFANNSVDTFSGTIGGSGANQNNLSLTKGGNGDLTLTGNNSFTGATVINDGILTLGSATALGSTPSIAFDGGTLQFSAANTTDYSSIIANSTSDIQIDTNGQNVTFANTIAGSNLGGLDKTGAGMLTLLDGGNTYGGNISITGGTLAVGNANVESSVYIANGAAIDLTFSFNTGYRFDMGVGGGVINGTGDTLVYNYLTGTSVTFGSFNRNLAADFLFVAGANVGTVNIVGIAPVIDLVHPANDLPAAYTRVLMGDGGPDGNTNLLTNNSTVNVEGYGILDFGTNSGTVTNAINLSSNSALETRGGVYTFTNVALPTAGLVTLGSDDVGGGALTFTGTAQTLTSDLTLAIGAHNGNPTPVILSMNIGGSGGLIETAGTSNNATGVSNLTLSGTNTYSGATTIDSGGLVVISGNNSGTGTVDNSVNVQNGTLQVATGGSISTNSNLILGNGSTSGVFVMGDGSNANNVTVNGLNSSGTGTGNAVVNGGSGNISTLTVTGSGTYGGAIGGSGSNQNLVALTKSGSGTLALTGDNNTYTGGTTVNGGTLQVNGTSGFTVGNGNVQVNAGGTLGGTGNVTLGAGHGITIASGGLLAPGFDPAGVASGIMTLTSAGGVSPTPVLTLAAPASPSTPAQLSFDLGSGVNPASGIGAGSVLANGITLAGSSTYVQLAIDAAGEVVFSNGANPTLVEFNPLIPLAFGSHEGNGDYLLFAGGANSDYANLTVDSDGLITGGLALDPDVPFYGDLYLKGGDIYIDVKAAPEPSTWAMLFMGLAFLGVNYYRRTRRASIVVAK